MCRHQMIGFAPRNTRVAGVLAVSMWLTATGLVFGQEAFGESRMARSGLRPAVEQAAGVPDSAGAPHVTESKVELRAVPEPASLILIGIGFLTNASGGGGNGTAG